jgi:hypothetical protein
VLRSGVYGLYNDKVVGVFILRFHCIAMYELEAKGKQTGIISFKI